MVTLFEPPIVYKRTYPYSVVSSATTWGDHCSLWKCVDLLLVHRVGKGEVLVRVSIVCQGFSPMLFLLSLVISKCAEVLCPLV